MMGFQISDNYVCVKCESAMDVDEDHNREGYEDYILVTCPNCKDVGVFIYD